MDPISIGKPAPNFSLEDNYGQFINLSDYKGKNVLLSWHPLAWTPICTDQMRSLENSWNKFQDLNTIPFGISVDAQPSKKIWAESLILKHLRLLSDFWPHGKVTYDYGMFLEKEGTSKRANVIIDENGIIRWVKIYQSEQLPDINEIIQTLSSMQVAIR